ncbi:cytochrome P450 [Nocardia sp. CA-084685]|uniref:cytochrome P450 n=1 Tax=Nocardia sp. CA-084685 TaxID=3239970 RepID=UPI003D9648BA
MAARGGRDDRTRCTIEPDEFIIISIAAANRDPKRFTTPDQFDPTRTDTRNIAFGHGIHYCIGAALARVEATIALTRLPARIPEMSLEIPASKLTWRKSLLIRGLTTLPNHLRTTTVTADNAAEDGNPLDRTRKPRRATTLNGLAPRAGRPLSAPSVDPTPPGKPPQAAGATSKQANV